jgi:predicted phage terminase large subunit-like protein
MFSRLGKNRGMNVPLLVRASANPGGESHDFVRQRFIVEGPEHGRLFIPARLKDNPGIDAKSYMESAKQLDQVTRRQLFEGDWDVKEEGNLFKRSWFETVPAGRVPVLRRMVRVWDLAATEVSERNPDPDWTAGVLMGVTEVGVYYVLDVVRVRSTPAVVKALVGQTARRDGRGVGVYILQEPASAGKSVVDDYRRGVLAEYECRGWRETGDKTTRARKLSSKAEYGDVKLVEGVWNTAFLDELTVFPQKGSHDDMVDAAVGALDVIDRGDAWGAVEWARALSPAIPQRTTRGLLLGRLQGIS